MLPRKGSRKCSRECSRECTRVCPQKFVFSVIISYKGSHSSAHVSAHVGAPRKCTTKWFGRMSPGLFSPALFLTHLRKHTQKIDLVNWRGGGCVCPNSAVKKGPPPTPQPPSPPATRADSQASCRQQIKPVLGTSGTHP